MSEKNKKWFTLRLIIGSSLTLLLIILTQFSNRWAKLCGLDLLKTIEIHGAELIPAADYKNSLQAILGSAIDEIDTREISVLLESHPYVHASRVSKIFPNTIKIELKERKPIALLNMNPVLFLDQEAVVLPELGKVNDLIIPVMSGFNMTRDLYPVGQQTVSQKVQESIDILKHIINQYPELYENTSEITVNSRDEYILILADYPTHVILGNQHIKERLQVLDSFTKSLTEHQELYSFSLLDLRFNRQVIASSRV